MSPVLSWVLVVWLLMTVVLVAGGWWLAGHHLADDEQPQPKPEPPGGSMSHKGDGAWECDCGMYGETSWGAWKHLQEAHPSRYNLLNSIEIAPASPPNRAQRRAATRAARHSTATPATAPRRNPRQWQ